MKTGPIPVTTTDFQSRLPGVGGSAARDMMGYWLHTPFNPVCRELGAPPDGGGEDGGFLALSIPFAGSWGLRPGLQEVRRALAPAFNPVCRELGAPPDMSAVVAWGDRLSIPFAGSWGLRLWNGTAARCCGAFNPVCRELGAPPDS